MNEEVFDRFAHLIRSRRVLSDHRDRHLSEYKARIILADGSIVEFTEILVHGIQKRKYSFQWMTGQFELLVRWDNASHHRHISTFPHHKHIGDENRIEASSEMYLTDVLQYISERLEGQALY